VEAAPTTVEAAAAETAVKAAATAMTTHTATLSGWACSQRQ
jgi:hypothetical protein